MTTIDHVTKQKAYDAADKVRLLVRKAGAEAARHGKYKRTLPARMHIAAAKNLVYDATVVLDELRDELDALDEAAFE